MISEALSIISDPAHVLAELVFVLVEASVGAVLAVFGLRRHDRKRHPEPAKGVTFIVAPLVSWAQRYCRANGIDPHGSDVRILTRPEQVRGLRRSEGDELVILGFADTTEVRMRSDLAMAGWPEVVR